MNRVPDTPPRRSGINCSTPPMRWGRSPAGPSSGRRTRRHCRGSDPGVRARALPVVGRGGPVTRAEGGGPVPSRHRGRAAQAPGRPGTGHRRGDRLRAEPRGGQPAAHVRPHQQRGRGPHPCRPHRDALGADLRQCLHPDRRLRREGLADDPRRASASHGRRRRPHGHQPHRRARAASGTDGAGHRRHRGSRGGHARGGSNSARGAASSATSRTTARPSSVHGTDRAPTGCARRVRRARAAPGRPGRCGRPGRQRCPRPGPTAPA